MDVLPFRTVVNRWKLQTRVRPTEGTGRSVADVTPTDSHTATANIAAAYPLLYSSSSGTVQALDLQPYRSGWGTAIVRTRSDQ
jgi:hypothetical protein